MNDARNSMPTRSRRATVGNAVALLALIVGAVAWWFVIATLVQAIGGMFA